MRISDWSSDVCSSDLEKERRAQFQAYLAVPAVRISILDRTGAERAGIVDENVQRRRMACHVGRRPSHAIDGGEVMRQEARRARSVQSLDEVFALDGAASDDDHIGACADQRPADHGAHSLGPAGDERGLALYREQLLQDRAHAATGFAMLMVWSAV